MTQATKDRAVADERRVPGAGDARVHEITPADREVYAKLIATELTDEEQARVVEPAVVHPRQDSVLAVHWHPEFVPMDLIRRRIDGTFPNCRHRLIIPTQHNMLTSYDGYTGAEVDCYSRSFQRKVQLLVHFGTSRLEKADVFKSMLAHTFRYRSRQLLDFIHTVIEDAFEDRLGQAARHAGADEEIVDFVRAHTRKLLRLYLENEATTPPEAVRNKLLMYYFDTLRDAYDGRLIDRAVALLRAVKTVVKANFSNDHFYATQEIIDEVRALGGGIVIPHPEQFWPILLAEYDVDGYEVWNPQSRDYTEFLIHVVNRQNKTLKGGQRPILIFMGDDCHMGEKVREPRFQDPEKAGREIGVQPAWEDLSIRKGLIVAGAGRHRVIEDYKARLGST